MGLSLIRSRTQPTTAAAADYVKSDGRFATRLELAGEKLVVVYLIARRNNGSRCAEFRARVDEQARRNRDAVFLVVDATACKQTAARYAVRWESALVFRKYRADAVRFEGADADALEYFVAKYRTAPPPPPGPADGWALVSVPDDARFENVLADADARRKLVVVYFVRGACVKCALFAPVVRDRAQSRPDVAFLTVDVDACPRSARTYQVGAVPTFVFRLYGAEVNRFRGADVTLFGQYVERYGRLLRAADATP